MTNYKGNVNRYTENKGHDTAKNRLADKLTNNGFNIYELRKIIFNNPTIKMLLNKQAIKISDITGQNFVIGAKDELLANYRHVNSVNAHVTVIQTVNNILNSILKNYGFTDYGKTLFWKNCNKKFIYNKRIYIGADILSYKWTQDNYTYKQFTCKLSDRQKIKKYR